MTFDARFAEGAGFDPYYIQSPEWYAKRAELRLNAAEGADGMKRQTLAAEAQVYATLAQVSATEMLRSELEDGGRR